MIFRFIAAILICAGPVAAHHSFAAEFDATRTVRVSGALTRVEWSNPHSHFYIDDWVCEAGGPGILTRRGIQKSDLKVGSLLTVEGYPAKDGAHRLDVTRITLSGGASSGVSLQREFSPAEPGK